MPRSAKEVIDQAIAENRYAEYFLYVLAGLFAVVGLSVLVWAMLNGQEVVAVAGAIASGLFWPALSSARRTRKESVALRLLEAPLSMADTSKQAAETLREVFADLFREQRAKEEPRAAAKHA